MSPIRSEKVETEKPKTSAEISETELTASAQFVLTERAVTFAAGRDGAAREAARDAAREDYRRGEWLSDQADHKFVGQTETNNVKNLDGNEECQLTFSGFKYGFLAAKPDYIDFSTLGPVCVRLTFAPPSVIAGTGTSYTISQLSATMEVATISNPSYESMKSSIMANKGYLPICFKEP